MNTKIKSIVVLTSICLIVSVLLAVTNHFTAPIIAINNSKKEFAACYEVMPEAKAFENYDLAKIENLPKTIKNVYEETSGLGYVFKMETSGYKPGLVIMCGVDKNGKITKVTTVSSQETEGIGTKTENPDYTNQYIGKDSALEGIVSITGATVTSTAFKNAVKDALVAYASIKGEVIVEPELKPIEIVMPNAKGFEDITSTLSNLPATVTQVQKEKSGLGYVFKMETEGFEKGLVILCGIDMDGKIINTATVSSNETPGIGTKVEDKEYTDQYVGKDSSLEGVESITGATWSSEAYYDAIKDAFKAYGIAIETQLKAVMPNATSFEDVTSTIDNLPKEVIKVYKETSGLGYVFKTETEGFEKGLIVLCAISSDGKVIDSLTLANNETPGLGTQITNPEYKDQYIGKDETLTGITHITGATWSSEGYYDAIKAAFSAFKLVAGGEANE